MFIDGNLTKTKAFREQLELHGELFASWADESPRAKENLFPKLGETWVSVKNWYHSLFGVEFRLDAGKSA